MATPMTATEMLTSLQREGLNVAQPYSGWRTHNRNHVGRWGGVNGIVIHHTAGSNSRTLCYYGTASLPGPLCHAHLEKSGKLNMIGHGRANHAGTFAANAHSAVVNERSSHPRPDASEPIDGNAHYYGIEIENLGNGRDPYPAAQYDAAVRWAAAICRHHGWSADSVIGHKEGTRRKIDPKGPLASGGAFDMDKFRADVTKRLAGKPDSSTNPTPKPEGENVPKTVGRTDDGAKTRDPGEWKALSIKGSTLVPRGSESYHVRVSLSLNAPAGGTIQGRYYHLRKDGSRWTDSVTERLTTGGTTFVDFDGVGRVHSDEEVRFECVYYPAESADTAPARIKRSRFRGLYWEA